jgi:hypothetical protein
VLGQLVVVHLGVVDERHRRVHDLAEVVRRYPGRHPDRDAVGAVDEQVRVRAGSTTGWRWLSSKFGTKSPCPS